jgi:broad specificity phosphatase PhoE
MIHPETEVHLYLIRHGESEMNLTPHIVSGRSPKTPLSPKGQEQSKKLGEWFREHRIPLEHIHSSPFLRAKMTACHALNIEPDNSGIVYDPRLIEYSAGDWEDKRRRQVQITKVQLQMAEMGIDFAPPGGESQRQVEQRVSEWLCDEIISNPNIFCLNREVHIAAFSHGLTIKCLLHHILHFDSHLIWRMEIDNCSITKLVFNTRGWWPKYINRVPY